MTDKPVDLRFPIKLESRNVVVVVVFFFLLGGKPENMEKNVSEDQQQTKPTLDTKSKILAPATMVEGKSVHLCIIPAPQLCLESLVSDHVPSKASLVKNSSKTSGPGCSKAC